MLHISGWRARRLGTLCRLSCSHCLFEHGISVVTAPQPPPPQVRLDLAQAVDAARYSTSMDDPAVEKAMLRAAVVAAALPQPPHTAVPLELQVVQLLALQRGFLDGVPAEQAATELERLSAAAAAAAPAALAEVAETRRLPAAAEAALLEALQAAGQRAGSSMESRAAA